MANLNDSLPLSYLFFFLSAQQKRGQMKRMLTVGAEDNLELPGIMTVSNSCESNLTFHLFSL